MDYTPVGEAIVLPAPVTPTLFALAHQLHYCNPPAN
jgi:hypothetical protein